MITRATVPETKMALEEELDMIYATPISSAPSSSSGESSKFRSPMGSHLSPCTSPILPKILAAVLPNSQGISIAPIKTPASVEVSQPINSKANQAPSATVLAQQASAVTAYDDALRLTEVCVCVCVSVCFHHIGLIILSSDTHSSGYVPGFNQQNIYNRHFP